MLSRQPNVVIVGAGVIGLTTGIRLAESGLRVTIQAHRRGPGTSSYAAGAIFDPYLVEHDRLKAWADTTRAMLEALASRNRLPWARMVSGVEASRLPLGGRPATTPDDAVRCRPEQLPVGFVSGWSYKAPLIKMPAYLRWLGRRFVDASGEIVERRLETLDEAFDDAHIVINCSGIGARDLVPDGEMQAIRGQLVLIRNPGINEFFIEQSTGTCLGDTTYVLPQGKLLVIGGNMDKGDPDPRPDPRVAAEIIERFRAAYPYIGRITICGHRAGVRPKRGRVRLEHEVLRGGRHIVHNYGHGGSGVSLAWGCAAEVAEIVRGILGHPEPPAASVSSQARYPSPGR